MTGAIPAPAADALASAARRVERRHSQQPRTRGAVPADDDAHSAERRARRDERRTARAAAGPDHARLDRRSTGPAAPAGASAGAPIDDYFDSRNSRHHHGARPPTTSHHPSVNGLHHPSLTDPTSSWVNAQLVAPPAAPPLESTVLEAPIEPRARRRARDPLDFEDDEDDDWADPPDGDVDRRRSSRPVVLDPSAAAPDGHPLLDGKRRRHTSRRATMPAAADAPHPHHHHSHRHGAAAVRSSEGGSDEYATPTPTTAPKRRRPSRRSPSGDHSPFSPPPLPLYAAGAGGGAEGKRGSWWKGLGAKIAGVGA
ncbi:MAG: hypothetical protein M1826_007007 [Phylliscum demangeonii]|nr:MAG: hypothetical protein M1826_007007 [Phylliscum demangeonii]